MLLRIADSKSEDLLNDSTYDQCLLNMPHPFCSIEDMTFIENTPFTFSKPEYEIAASDFLRMDRYCRLSGRGAVVHNGVLSHMCDPRHPYSRVE